MRLSNRHANLQTVSRADFSGGLNTTANVDGIAENQLVDCLNIEIEHNTGRMKSIAGTVEVVHSEKNIFAAMWDEINKKILLVFEDKTVHVVNSETRTIGNSIGTLSGNVYPKCESWEDGILIASGGKLQYFNGTSLITLNSPNADEVYTRAGRVIISFGQTIRYSGVGDETNWTEDTGDASTSKFVEVGYKDGGNFIGMVNLSQDLLIIKNNRRLYRLSGEFPDWSISGVSRNIECSGRLSFCAVADSVFILGKNEVQAIQTTQYYGDVKPQNVASLVVSEVQRLPVNSIMRYIPPLNQIWCIGENGFILFYDLVSQSWFKRRYNSVVVDVISVGDEVFLIRRNGITKLEENTFYDAGLPLRWNFQAQRIVSQHEYLLKRTQISVVPLSAALYSGQINAGSVVVSFPVPDRNIKIYQNKSLVYKNHTKICLTARNKFVYVKGEKIFDNLEPIYGNTKKIFGRLTMIKSSLNVYRNKFIDIRGFGSSGGFLLNGIILDIAEV